MMSSSLLSTVETDLIGHEGLRSKPYKDTEGFLTIGVGHNLDAEGLCREAIMVQLRYDLAKVELYLDRYLPWWTGQPEGVKRALMNLMFNMGPAKLLKFARTLKSMQEGRYADAAAELLQSKYASQVGKRAHDVAGWIRDASKT